MGWSFLVCISTVFCCLVGVYIISDRMRPGQSLLVFQSESRRFSLNLFYLLLHSSIVLHAFWSFRVKCAYFSSSIYHPNFTKCSILCHSTFLGYSLFLSSFHSCLYSFTHYQLSRLYIPTNTLNNVHNLHSTRLENAIINHARFPLPPYPFFGSRNPSYSPRFPIRDLHPTRDFQFGRPGRSVTEGTLYPRIWPSRRCPRS